MTENSTNQPGLFDTPDAPRTMAAPVQPTPKPQVKAKAGRKQLRPIPPPEKKPAKPRQRRGAAVAPRTKSGLVPAGDVRLTANINAGIHLKLKIVAAQRRTTIGELIEELVENYLESPYGV